MGGSASNVCNVNSNGNANNNSATNGWIRPRPWFLCTASHCGHVRNPCARGRKVQRSATWP